MSSEPEGPARPTRASPSTWLAVGGLVVLLIVLGAIVLGGSDDDPDTAADDPVVSSTTLETAPPDSAATTTSPSTTASPATTVPEPAAPAPRTSFEGEGVYRVGEDIAPGRYRQGGESGPCFWARLAELTGKTDAQIASNLSEGPSEVTIAASDKFFQTHGCGTWNKVG